MCALVIYTFYTSASQDFNNPCLKAVFPFHPNNRLDEPGATIIHDNYIQHRKDSMQRVIENNRTQ
jgi:hypothetical protein